MSGENKIQSWENHYSNAKERQMYSIKRIDLLTISISGACIYIVFEILRFINSSEYTDIQSCVVLLKISAVSAIFAIAINFISQVFGYLANKYEAKYSREVIDQIENKIDDKATLNDIDFNSRLFNNLTSISNIISILFMTAGITLLVIYNLVTF